MEVGQNEGNSRMNRIQLGFWRGYQAALTDLLCVCVCVEKANICRLVLLDIQHSFTGKRHRQLGGVLDLGLVEDSYGVFLHMP